MQSNIEWKKWGQVDPLFAVSSWKGRQKGGENPWTDSDFYALGESDAADFLEQWQNFGVDPARLVEIGCGAGRLTRHFASHFSAVTALDVSEGQLAYARSRIHHSNITWRLTDGVRFSADVPKATAVFSAHVFQHFDSLPDAAAVFQEVERCLLPEGTLMIHLPIYRLPATPLRPALANAIGWAKWVGTQRARLNRKRGKLIMRGLWYERGWLEELLDGLGFRKVEFRTFRVRSNRDWHDFVFAQK